MDSPRTITRSGLKKSRQRTESPCLFLALQCERPAEAGARFSLEGISEVRDASGQRTHFVAVMNDITDRKRAEQELRYLANYDTFTGLPNRTLLGERATQSREPRNLIAKGHR